MCYDIARCYSTRRSKMLIPELKKSLTALKISPKDHLYVASSLPHLGIPKSIKENIRKEGIKYLLDSYIETFLDLLGSEGTLVMPTYTYSACNGKEFDPQKTPSTVGLLTENFRKYPGVQRTLHPIFSLAVKGYLEKELLKCSYHTCFGQNSIFAYMREKKFKYLMLGVSLSEGATFVYHAEEVASVPYRYIKIFNGTIKDQSFKPTRIKVEYFVRNLKLDYTDSWKKLESDAFKAKIITKNSYSGSEIMSMKAHLIHDFIISQIQKNKNYLIDINV